MSAANNRLMVKYEPESTDLICIENKTDIIIYGARSLVIRKSNNNIIVYQPNIFILFL